MTMTFVDDNDDDVNDVGNVSTVSTTEKYVPKMGHSRV